MQKSLIHIGIADDHQLFQHALELELKEKEGLQLRWQVRNGFELLTRLDNDKPDVLLMNLDIAGKAHYQQTMILLRQLYKPLKVIILILRSDPDTVRWIMSAGANACLPRAASSEETHQAILSCHKNGFYFDNLIHKVGLSVKEIQNIYSGTLRLSETELRVLQLFSEDKFAKEVAQKIGLSIRRVEAIRQEIKHKMGVKTISGLIARAVRNKLVDCGCNHERVDKKMNKKVAA